MDTSEEIVLAVRKYDIIKYAKHYRKLARKGITLEVTYRGKMICYVMSSDKQKRLLGDQPDHKLEE